MPNSIMDKVKNLPKHRQEAIEQRFKDVSSGVLSCHVLSEQARHILNNLYKDGVQLHNDYLGLVYLHDAGLITDDEYVHACEVLAGIRHEP